MLNFIFDIAISANLYTVYIMYTKKLTAYINVLHNLYKILVFSFIVSTFDSSSNCV